MVVVDVVAGTVVGMTGGFSQVQFASKSPIKLCDLMSKLRPRAV